MPRSLHKLGPAIVVAAFLACSNVQGQAGPKSPDSGVSPSNRAPEPTRTEPLRATESPAVTAEPQLGAPPQVATSSSGKSEGASQQIAPPGSVPESVPEVTLTFEALAETGMRRRPEGGIAAAVEDEALQVWNFGGSSSPGSISSRAGFHPGTRVIVDASPLLSPRFARSKAGTQVQRRLQAGLRNRGYWPFRLCFEEASRSGSKLGGGKTRLRLTVAASGVVGRARQVSSTVKSPLLGRCLEQAAKSLRTDLPLGLRVQADVTVSTWPGDLPVLPLPLRRQASSLGPAVVEALSDAIVRQRDAIRACFVAGRSQDPALWGRLELSFAVDSNLRALGIREEASHFPSPEVTRCVSAALAQTSFSRDSQGQRISLGVRLARPPAPEGAPPPAEPSGDSPTVDTPAEAPEADTTPRATDLPGAGTAPCP